MFDRPIGGFQIQQERLADMLTEIVKGQLLSLHLGRMKDAGTFTPQQVSLAKRNNVQYRDRHRPRGAPAARRERHSRRVLGDAAHGESGERVHVRGHARRALAVLGQAITGLSAFK